MNKQIKPLLASGQTDQAITLLTQQLHVNRASDKECLLLAQLQYEQQLVPESVATFNTFLHRHPDHTEALLALAQSQFLAGYDASDTFLQLTQLTPGLQKAWHGYALSLASRGDIQQADAVLNAQLVLYPDWVEGHTLLATLRYVNAQHDTFLAPLEHAVSKHPGHVTLHKSYFNLLVQNKDWHKAWQLINTMRLQPELAEFSHVASILVAVESGQTANLDLLLQRSQHIDDTALDLALVRHFIKQQQLDLAEAIAMRRVARSSALVFIPYLSIIWRLTGSPYFHWLEHNNELVKSQPVQFSDEELLTLQQCLNRLHSAKSPFIEQSVRGGTQTDQHLLLRHEPILRALRDKLKEAVKLYTAQLPQGDSTHPLLGKPRAAVRQGEVLFSGSWSVKLRSQGYNVSHTHPKGWLSSALHLKLPDSKHEKEADAGYIQFGTPPAELNLDLPPTLKVKPVVGNVVLFPSTMWHSTVPFNHGERLAVAFDVQSPKR